MTLKDYIVLAVILALFVAVLIYLIIRIKNHKYCFSKCQCCPMKNKCSSVKGKK